MDNPQFPVTDMFSELISKRIIDKNTFYDQIFLKLDFLSSSKTTNDKIRLRNLLYTYF